MDAKPAITLLPFSWDRMVQAVEKVRERLLRSTTALNQAGVAYAVIGGNAVAAWVARVDESAVRNTVDVDLLVRRSDFLAVTAALTGAGFVHYELLGVEMFLDGPEGKPRQAIHLLFAGEKVKGEYHEPAPAVEESVMGEKGYRVLELEALVRMKLTSFRDKDRTHLRDLIDVGLITTEWPNRFLPELAARLQHLFDTPGG